METQAIEFIKPRTHTAEAVWFVDGLNPYAGQVRHL